MATIHRLESNNPRYGGVVIGFPSGYAIEMSWRSRYGIQPTIDAAKDYAAKALQTLIEQGKQDDADRTNWVSVTAAIERHIKDFNDALRASLPAVQAARNVH